GRGARDDCSPRDRRRRRAAPSRGRARHRRRGGDRPGHDRRRAAGPARRARSRPRRRVLTRAPEGRAARCPRSPLRPSRGGKLGSVLARYGIEVYRGAEYAARMLAERLVERPGWSAEVFTTCALDTQTWANELAPGRLDVNGVTVHRF